MFLAFNIKFARSCETGRGGAGATIGKIYGTPMKGGVGTASLQIPGGPVVAALAVVNALGDIWDQGHIVVGALNPDGTFVNQTRAMMEGAPSQLYYTSTTIARLADDGMARAISPNHTQWDGDTIICLALGTHTSSMSRDAVVTQVGTAAALVLEQAILRGALAAQK